MSPSKLFSPYGLYIYSHLFQSIMKSSFSHCFSTLLVCVCICVHIIYDTCPFVPWSGQNMDNPQLDALALVSLGNSTLCLFLFCLPPHLLSLSSPMSCLITHLLSHCLSLPSKSRNNPFFEYSIQ